MPWLETTADCIILRLRVQPGAKRTAVIGTLGDQLKIAVQAPPIDGKANDALLSWLTQTLSVKRGQVSLISGQSSRDKRVSIKTMQAAQIRAALGLSDEID